jgi:hypothetical protein
MPSIPNNRQKLINYIRTKNKFYAFVDFAGHSDEQLIAIRSKIVTKKKARTNALAVSKIFSKK